MDIEKIKENYFKRLPKTALCIDWETSGSTWGGDSSKDHQGISFGAVIVDLKDFTPIKTLYKEIIFDDQKYKWSLDAQNIHGLTREHLKEHGVSQQEAAMLLAEFISDNISSDVMLIGHNAEFDRRFTNQLLETIDIQFTTEPDESRPFIKLHHVIIDTACAGFVSLGLHKSDLLFNALGFQDRNEHNALTDALMTVETCQCIRLLCQHSFKNL